MAENEAPAAGTDGIGDADASQLAAMLSQVTDEQLAEAMAHPDGRKMVLDEIFKRMAEHVEPGAIDGVDAVVHFKITDAPGGGDDTFEVVIKDGEVKVNTDPAEQPKVTLTAAPVPFLKLVTGQQSGPVMFLTGKLRIEGDVMFASRMTSFFRIPTATG
jgi:putative sterol carrier protein